METKTRTYTAQMITLSPVLTGWKTTGMISIGSVKAGTYNIRSFDALRTEEGGWEIRELNNDQTATVKTLKDVKAYIADKLNA